MSPDTVEIEEYDGDYVVWASEYQDDSIRLTPAQARNLCTQLERLGLGETVQEARLSEALKILELEKEREKLKRDLRTEMSASQEREKGWKERIEAADLRVAAVAEGGDAARRLRAERALRALEEDEEELRGVTDNDAFETGYRAAINRLLSHAGPAGEPRDAPLDVFQKLEARLWEAERQRDDAVARADALDVQIKGRRKKAKPKP